ncbi:MAG: cell division protein FtsQ/DivIB [Betaproteobacteria bacterium]|nr:cell division protein FtsQ/DivIB [Betaproteobacteria bacterium]
MWDKPAALHMLTDLLVVTALLGLLYAGVTYVVRLPVFPVQEVRVVMPLKHVTREQIEAIVSREVRGTFFTLQLGTVRTAFEKLPWVRRAEVRRHWPGQLEVVLTEHEPLARWGRDALVNVQGEVFEAVFDGALPVFNGPAGVAKEMAIQYDHFRRSLAAIAKTPGEINVSPRRAWQIRLSDGMTLDLGREHVEQRLQRFVVTYPRTIARMTQPVDRVDLRYANGFAVRVPGLPPALDTPGKRGA